MSSLPTAITLVTTDLGWGGTERIVWELARALVDEGLRVAVIGLCGAGELRRRLAAEGIAVHGLGAPRPWRARPGPLRALLAQLHPDLVHAHLYHANRLVRLARPPCPILTTEHTVETRPLPQRTLVERRLARRSAAVACVSHAVAEDYFRRIRPPAAKVRIIPPGVRAPASLAQRDAIGAGAPLRAGFLGRLVRAKGADLLPRAFPAGMPAGLELRIAGEGPLRASLERWARRSRASVQLDGFQGEIDPWLASLDTLVVPARIEGFGLAAAEALVRAIPPLMSDLPALRELHSADADFDPHFSPDPRGLRGALERFQRDPLAAQRWARAQAAAARRRFSLAAMVAAYRELYRELCSARGT